MWSVFLLAAAAVVSARDVTDDEYTKFPRLYHLDDYDACLSQSDGLYCLGTFAITPLKEPDYVYNMMKEYSQDPHHFNRTEIHRGYCVSSRCSALATERNTTLRFEQCASQWGRRRSLRTTLTKLSYCRTYAQEYAKQHNPEPLDIPHRVFIYVVMALLAVNTLGTLYDVFTSDDAKKNELITIWSLRTNWRRLTATYEDGNPKLSALTPVQGVRVLLMILIIATHSGCIHDMLYIYNPRWIEQISRHPVLMIFLNGTSVVQIFVTLSNFLLSYNMLLFFKTKPLGLKVLPLITLKRIFRTMPVSLLVVGYAATWWTRSNSGPMWSIVGAESEICRNKFWTHVFYINNLVKGDDICLVQTWFLAVDMQLYIVAAFLTLILAPLRRRALPILLALVVASSLLNGALAYIFNWKSIMYFAYPSQLKNMYKNVPSFARLYQTPWGSLPGCMIGLFCGFLNFELQEANVKITSFRLFRFFYHMAPPVMIAWILLGNYLRQFTEPWFTAAYVAVERPALSAMGAFVLMGFVNGFHGWLRDLFAWRGWHAMGRMSLSVMAIHWCINMSFAAGRPQTIPSSVMNVFIDATVTAYCSYMLAIPMTLMVEIPVQRFLSALVF